MASIEEEIQSSFKNEQQKAMVNIMFTANWFRSLHTNALKPKGLSTEQYNILRILNGSKEPRMKMSCVRDRMIDPAPNTTRLMDRLLEKGAVERERCASDRRVVYVKVTEQGRKLLKETDAYLNDIFSALEAGLTEQMASELNQAIELFRASVEKHIAAAQRSVTSNT